MTDGSIFDTTWLTFLRHMALFFAPIGSLPIRSFFTVRNNQAAAHGVDRKFHYVIKFCLFQNG